MSTPVKGTLFLLKVGANVVEGLNKYNKQRTRNTQTFAVFNRATPWAITQPKEEKYSVGGLYMPGDPGQAALLAAEIAQTPITITVLPDGVTGFSQEVYVTSRTGDATPDGYQEVTYDFLANADAASVGGGELV